jgi:hypothetical protein
LERKDTCRHNDATALTARFVTARWLFMTRAQLTLKGVRVRPVVVPLKRPIVSKVGLYHDWPLILIDLYTNEGVVGHSYLEPYIKQSASSNPRATSSFPTGLARASSGARMPSQGSHYELGSARGNIKP